MEKDKDLRPGLHGEKFELVFDEKWDTTTLFPLPKFTEADVEKHLTEIFGDRPQRQMVIHSGCLTYGHRNLGYDDPCKDVNCYCCHTFIMALQDELKKKVDKLEEKFLKNGK